jgi:predicted RNase H-like nuclease (RuvC/YqgF family)
MCDKEIDFDESLEVVKKLHNDAIEKKDAEIYSLKRRIEEAQKTIAILEKELSNKK